MWPHIKNGSFSSQRTSPYYRTNPGHSQAQVSLFQNTNTPSIPSSSFNSGDFGSMGFPVTPGRNPTQSATVTSATWDSPLDLRCAPEGEGYFASDANTATWHSIKPQGPNNRPTRPPPTQQTLTCVSIPISSTFSGLGTNVVEGSYSVLITDSLIQNYNNRRMVVTNEKGVLNTPLRFLCMLCQKMGINSHMESFIFRTVKTAHGTFQFRTEVFVGGFCGVAHALSLGLSKQLAAAHCLERMKIRYPGLKDFSYALFPGCTHTKIKGKLDELCVANDLGLVREAVDERQGNGGGGAWGGTNGGNSRSRARDLEGKWECRCVVKDFLEETVLSDSQYYGAFEAKSKMYLKIVKALDLPVVQIKDYFAIGEDCPKFMEIHRSVMLYQPSTKKRQWMEEYGVPQTQMDAVLQDPTNRSSYLNERSVASKLATFGEELNKALGWTREENSRRFLGSPRFGQTRDSEMGAPMNVRREDLDAMETRDEDMDEADCEVEQIYYDAVQDMQHN